MPVISPLPGKIYRFGLKFKRQNKNSVPDFTLKKIRLVCIEQKQGIPISLSHVPIHAFKKRRKMWLNESFSIPFSGSVAATIWVDDKIQLDEGGGRRPSGVGQFYFKSGDTSTRINFWLTIIIIAVAVATFVVSLATYLK